MSLSVVNGPAIEHLLEKLDGVKGGAGGKWTALCPAHEDRNASLSITTGKDGRVLMKCHAGCATAAIVAAIGLSMTDLFADNGELTPRGPKIERAQGVDTRSRHVGSYDYLDADGHLLFQVCRFEPKTFRQRHRVGDSDWIWGLGDIKPILYRLPEVLEHVSMGRRIFVVEGEKDADALAGFGYPATTNPMGAGKWRDEYADALKGAEVVVFPDNDDVGRSHAVQIAASVVTRGGIAKIVNLPGLPAKGDVSDWLDGGGDFDELEVLIGKTPRYDGTSDGKRRTRWRLDELWENDEIMRPPPPIVPRLAWAGRSTLLAAREKSGKSTLIGYIAAQLSRGQSFLGESCARGDVLIIGLEEFLGDAARRLRHFDADATRVHLVDAFLGDPRERPRELAAHLDATKPMLVVVDSLSAYSHGQVQDDNNATQMAAVVQPLTDLAHERHLAFIIVHHARKSDGRARGSTAITAGADVVCEFFCPDDAADPTLRRMRSAGRVPVQPVYDVRFDGDHYRLAMGLDAPIEAQILHVVTDRPGCSMNDVAMAVDGRRDDVMKAIRGMIVGKTLINLGASEMHPKLAVPVVGNLGMAL